MYKQPRPAQGPQQPSARAQAGNARAGMVLLLVGIGVGLLGISSAFYTVQPEERAVVKRFGKVVAINEPGLHFKLPFGIDSVQKVATERVLK